MKLQRMVTMSAEIDSGVSQRWAAKTLEITPTPPGQRPGNTQGIQGGKHKRACDSCAGLRMACNGDNSCAECAHRRRLCTYQRLHEDVDGTGYSQEVGMNSQCIVNN